MLVEATAASTTIFYGHDTVTGANCTINYDAAMTCTGTVSGSALRSSVRTADGRTVPTYTREERRASIEDVGTAAISAGIARVALDPSFAAAIAPDAPYHVFVTPLGDTRGLYVAATTARGFTVLEAQGGRSALSFDYRIVAQPREGR
jgi:hypothetical protein